MFKRLHFANQSVQTTEPQSGTADDEITFSFNQQVVTARRGDTVATALLLNNIIRFGQRGGIDKGPFCLMGACYECLVQVNGRSLQACMLEAVQDMQVMPLILCNHDADSPATTEHDPDDNSQ